MRRVVSFGVLSLALVAVGGLALRAADDKPKQTIKEVMKLHKDKLHEKFQKGEASKEEKEKLLAAYEALGKNKPPKGEEKAWKEKCDALLKAAKDLDAGKDGAKEAFGKAVKCGDCHSAHKSS